MQDRDTLIEQSVKYSNRTVTTHNATFIVILVLVFVLQVKKVQGVCKA